VFIAQTDREASSLQDRSYSRSWIWTSENLTSRHVGEYIECDNKDTLIPRRRRDLFEDLHIPIPIAVTAVAHLAALLIGGSLLWYYRGPILTHLGKLGMALLVFGLAFFLLAFVLNIALMLSRLLLF
jgi:hypothetical protein